MERAIKRGDVEAVKTLIEKSYPTISQIKEAVRRNHLPLIEFLHSQNPLPPDLLPTAVAWDRTEMAKYLVEIGQEPGETMNIAANNGNLELVEYLSQHGSKCSQYSFRRAAEYGHLSVVKYLHQSGIANRDSSAIRDAVMRRKSEMVKYLFQQGYKDPEIMDLSAQ